MAVRARSRLGRLGSPSRRRTTVKLSIRNQLSGTVETRVNVGAVMAIVKVRLDGGQVVTASVTAEEVVADLGLAEGSPVTVLVKLTEVSLAVE